MKKEKGIKQKQVVGEKRAKQTKAKRKAGVFQLNLFSMLTMLSLLPLVLSVVIIGMVSLTITKGNMEKSAQDTLYIASTNLSNYCKQNNINAINVGNYYDYLDSLKDKNIELAIIIEGTPSATSIRNENDYRIREIPCDSADRQKLENGYFDAAVEVDGKVYYAYYMPIEYDGEIIGMSFAGQLQENATGAVKSIILTFVVMAVSMVVLFAVITLICSRKLTQSVKAVQHSVKALSEGNLGAQKVHKGTVKEMQELLGETVQMQSNLSDIINQVKDVSGRLIGDVEEVTGLSNSSAGRAQEITHSMDELTAATLGMAEHVQDINMQMMEIGTCVNDISENVEQLYSRSEHILQANNAAKQAMDDIMDSSKKSVEAVSDITAQISETNASISEIDKAVRLILEISGQTNLLALNASIEAARAGDAGRGFAVVAEEIRHLAEQSAEGAEMIKNLAKTITDKSGKSAALAEDIRVVIMQEQESVMDTQKKYEELSNNINQSVEGIRSIAQMTENLASYKEHVIENVQSLSAFSEENAASNQEVSANVTEIISEVQMVNEHCEKMSEMAGDLEQSVAYFHN